MGEHEATTRTFEMESLAPEWRRAFAWVEATVGGRLLRAERHARWRPAWFLDVERGGEILPLYWRGDRGLEGINSVYDVRYESIFYPILEDHGIPVPHLHGLCEDPLGILLGRVPGRANLATADSEAERDAVLREYIEILARIHAIDPVELERKGLARPREPKAIAQGDLEIWVREFHKAKRRPEPMLEFLIGWCRRNAPEHRRQASLVLSDSGQFLFEAGRVTSVIDLELAFLGDPLADLAAMRTRDMAEPMGDLPAAFRHYEKVSGCEVDLHAVRYHSARFNLYTPLTTAHLLADPPPGLDYGLYLA
jgi:aminoglycoside phosphotransferase (APT) family kinase protein